MLEMMTEEKEVESPLIPLPFNLGSFISKSKVERWENVHVSRSEIKTVAFLLGSISPALVKTKYVCMHELQI